MKVDGSNLNDAEIFSRVAAAVRDISGIRLEKINHGARLREDLGVHGDDGYDLLVRLDDEFAVDWSCFDLGVHFGWEGLGAPLPWHVAGSPYVFQPQPVTVNQLVQAIRSGCWSGTPMVPVSPARRLWVYAVSWAQFGLLFCLPIILVLALAATTLFGNE